MSKSFKAVLIAALTAATALPALTTEAFAGLMSITDPAKNRAAGHNEAGVVPGRLLSARVLWRLLPQRLQL